MSRTERKRQAAEERRAAREESVRKRRASEYEKSPGKICGDV